MREPCRPLNVLASFFVSAQTERRTRLGEPPANDADEKLGAGSSGTETKKGWRSAEMRLRILV
jgi:hypothetical protein